MIQRSRSTRTNEASIDEETLRAGREASHKLFLKQHAIKSLIESAGQRYANTSINNFYCECERQAIAKNQSVESINCSCEEKRARKTITRWVDRWEDRLSLVLYGPGRTGKDHLAIGAACRLINTHLITCSFVYGVDLYSASRDRITNNQTEAEFLRQFFKPDLLIISDPFVDASPLTDAQASLLYQIINRRVAECKPTIVTANAESEEKLEGRLGGAVWARMSQDALIVHATWKSFKRSFIVKS